MMFESRKSPAQRALRRQTVKRRLVTAIATSTVIVASVVLPGAAGRAEPAAAAPADGHVLVHYDMTREGNVLKDSSGRGLDARLVDLPNAAFRNEGSDAVIAFSDGGYVELPDFIGEEESLAIEIRYKAGSVDNEGLFSLGTASGGNYLRFHPRVNSKLLWESKYAGKFAKSQHPVAYAPDGYSTAIAVIRSTGMMEMYLDGSKIGSLNLGAAAPGFKDPNTAVLGFLGRSVYAVDPSFSGTLTDFIAYRIDEQPPPPSTATRIVSTTFPTKAEGKNWWRSSLITGNGENGALVAGNPTDDTLIYQNMAFNMPNNSWRDTPDMTPYLEGVRQSLIAGDVPAINPSWSLQYDYTFHPGHELNLHSVRSGPVSGNHRWTDFHTGEAGVSYSDAKGSWNRTTFASRTDNVVVTRISSSSTGAKIDMDLDITPIDEMAVETGSLNTGLRYKQFAAADGSVLGQVAHYPANSRSELKEGGYGGVTYVITKGGTRSAVEIDKPLGVRTVPGTKYYGVSIADAEEVILVTKSARDVQMGTLADFGSASTYPLIERLEREIQSVLENPAYQGEEGLSYDAMLAPHAAEMTRQFETVRLNLDGAEADRQLSSEALIAKQQANASTLNQAMVERAFNAGRYATISSSGYSTPRLGAMWTGAWNGSWQADWTTDANVNLQIAGANIGNLSSEIEGYVNFLLRIAPDWETNAARIYGMQDALLAPPRTDSDRGSLVHFTGNNGLYPFEYWNSGASWLLQPVYELWTTQGDVQIPLAHDIDLDKLASVLSPSATDLTAEQLEAKRARGYLQLVPDVLAPLLRRQAAFWEQLVDPRYFQDSTGAPRYDSSKTSLSPGEHYLLLPCYSPENLPKGGNSAIAVNCSMDIAAARDGLRMASEIEEQVNGAESPAISRWENLLSKLPPVTYDETGALKEWSLARYAEQHAHRHVSHAYFAWPAHESQTSAEISDGLTIAMELRKATAGDKSSGHGWLHMGLVDARLKNASGTTESLLALLSKNAYYSSFTTNHNVTGDSAYASDILNTFPALLLESLVYSDAGRIQILPALPEGMQSGQVTGPMARTRAEITALEWDVTGGSASVTITSQVDQTVELTNGLEWATADVNGSTVRNVGSPIELTLDEGEPTTVTFALGELDPAASFTAGDADVRCIAGKAMLAMSATNTDAVPLDMTVESAYGSKRFDSVGPGKSVFHSFTTRGTQLEAGEIVVTARGPGLQDSRRTASYRGGSCR